MNRNNRTELLDRMQQMSNDLGHKRDWRAEAVLLSDSALSIVAAAVARQWSSLLSVQLNARLKELAKKDLYEPV